MGKPGDGHVARQRDLVAQQQPERGLADRHLPRVIQLVVAQNGQAVTGHEQKRAGRIILEAHPAGPHEPHGARGRGVILGDLQEMGAQAGQAVQVILHLVDCRHVRVGQHGGMRLIGPCMGRTHSGGQAGEQDEALHGLHVTPASAQEKAQAPAFRSFNAGWL